MRPMINIIWLASLIGVSGATFAQQSYQYNDRYSEYPDSVVVYKDCEFLGESRRIDIGDYLNMGAFDFDNDSISSIRVPPGLEVTLYKDDKFRGDYARVDRDIVCFDQRWNDEVSSLRVYSTNRNSSDAYQNTRRSQAQNSGQNNHGIYREDHRRGSDYRPNNGRNQNYNNRVSRNSQPGVNAGNLSQIVFANRILQQTGPKKWEIADSRFGVSQYREVSRDSNAVYLQNDYTAEKVRIDLFTNDVTFVKRNGQRNSYPITNKRASLLPAQANNNNSHSNRNIRGNCFDYKAYTRGGAGGIRFHGHDGFYRFRSKPHSGRICHDGALTMELNKTLPATEVVVEIQGKKYRFGRNEKEDALKNTWYRKKIVLKVGN